MSSRHSRVIEAVDIMLNGSLRRINSFKAMNKKALYDE